MPLVRYDDIVRGLRSSSGFRDASILIGGNGAAQLIQLAAMPLLLRLYDPLQYGIFAMCMAAAAVVAVLQTFRLEVVIPVSTHMLVAARIFAAIRVLSLAMVVAQVLLILIFRQAFDDWLRDSNDDLVIAMLIPCLAVTSAWCLAYRAWLIRQGRFRKVASAFIARSVVFVIAAIMLALLKQAQPRLAVFGLMIAQLAADWVALAILSANVPRRLRVVASMWRFRRIAAMVAREKHLLGAISVGQLISIINQSWPTWFVGTSFGAEMAGWLALAQRIMMAPPVLIANSVGAVISQRIAILSRQGQQIFIVLRKAVTIAAFSLPCFLLGAILALYWTGSAFGVRWESAGTTLAIMAFVGFIAVVYSTIEGVPILLKMNRFLVEWHLGRLVLLAASFLLATRLDLPYLQWLIIYAGCEFTVYAVYCLVSLRTAKKGHHVAAEN